MIAILGFLAKLSVILGLGAAVFTSISDLMLKTNYLEQLDALINLGSPRIKIVLALVAAAYLVIFTLSFINRLTKYSQNRKVKNKSGEIEVTIKTINEVSKDFLGSKDIIKNNKIKSYPSGRAVIIEAVVDTYNVDNLNEKLSRIQEELSEHVFKVTGITVKKSKVKLKKVAGETIIEKKIIKEPETVNVKTVETIPEYQEIAEPAAKTVEEVTEDTERSEGDNQ